MKKMIATAVSALVLGSGMALAQMAEGPWTMEEFMVAYPEVTPEIFAEIDTNNDGLIDEDELEAAVEAGLVAPSEG